mgnify:CR=1 FL=1
MKLTLYILLIILISFLIATPLISLYFTWTVSTRLDEFMKIQTLRNKTDNEWWVKQSKFDEDTNKQFRHVVFK